MTARYSWSQVIKELRGAQSTLVRADVKHRPRIEPEFHDALVFKARAAMAEALRTVKTLRALTRRRGAMKRRRAA